MQTHLIVALLCFFAGDAMAAKDKQQDQFDESVGYAYGYTLMATRMGEKCAELYPETATSIADGLKEWKARNSEALAEINIQWTAYAKRDAVTKGSQPSVDDALEREIPGAVKRNFEMMGGFRSAGARDRCTAYSLMLLNEPTFRLERKFVVELANFRACTSNGRCRNLKRAQ